MSEMTDSNEKQFLIFASGLPEDGQPMTEQELQEALAAGKLNSGDLVWADGAWHQFSDIFEMAPYALPDYTDSAETELALTLKELPSSNVKGAPDHKDSQGAHRSLCQRSPLLRLAFYGRGMRRRPCWQLFLLLLSLLALMACVVLYGLIPAYNQMMWKPAYVLVVNPFKNAACSFTFDGEEYQLKPNGRVTIPDIFGRMPRTETLKFTFDKDKEPESIEVPLRAGETVLVNPNGRIFFGVIKTNVPSVQVTQADCKALMNQLTTGKVPEAAVQLGDRMKEYGTKLMVAQTDAPLIYSTDSVVQEGKLNFEQLGLERSPTDLEKRPDMAPPEPGVMTRNLLYGIAVTGGKVKYRKGSADVAECAFPLQVPWNFNPPVYYCKKRPPAYRFFKPILGKSTCIVSYEGKEIVVQVVFDRKDFVIRRNQRDLSGTWKYVARKHLDTGKWSWRWTYHGTDKIKVGALDLTITDRREFLEKYREQRSK